MARKEQFNTREAVGTLVARNNAMSNYIGDLDSLGTRFKTLQLADSPDIGKFDDSSIVKALNHLDYRLDSINTFLTSGTSSITVHNIEGDSAQFNKINVGSITIDSANFDSARIINLSGLGLRYDSANIDSARITNLSGININYDSGEFNVIRGEEIFGDSARISALSGTGTLNYPLGTFGVLNADSANIVNFSADSINVSGISIGGTMSIDGQTFSDAKQFTIKDSTGTVIFGGFFLSTSNTLGTP
tara:strand:- start:268 stop:1008 length:741 start_codon:yes stop_codon:yes gene_type:complete